MEQFYSTFVQNLVNGLGVTALVAFIGVCYSLIKKFLADAKAKNPDLFAQIAEIAKMVVDAAEEAGASQIIEDKEKWAIDLAEKFLAAQGIKIDLSIMVAAIKAAVKNMRDEGKEMVSMKTKLAMKAVKK